MKRILLVLVLVAAVSFPCVLPGQSSATVFTFGCPRDWECCMLFPCKEAPCMFPLALNPCAVPCPPPSYQPQAVPCAFVTACPSMSLPCHGVSYGMNPYPLFK